MNASDQRAVPTRGIAAFDFDGTLTTRDSFAAFLAWRRPRLRFLADQVAAFPLLLLYAAGLVPNETHKMALFRRRFADMPLPEYLALAGNFAREKLPALLRPSAVDCLRRHRALGHPVTIVTASFADWITPWAAQEGVNEVIASQVEVASGRLTGRMAGPNCHGPEKLHRLLARHPERATYVLFAYGDGRGDRDLLEAADHAFYRRFA